jgi:hypothetical protein
VSTVLASITAALRWQNSRRFIGKESSWVRSAFRALA